MKATYVTYLLLAGVGASLVGLFLHFRDYPLPGNQEGYMPQQPIAFSHKLHAGDLTISCLYCHYSAVKSPHAGIPPGSLCMNCHRLVTNSWEVTKAELDTARQADRPPRRIVSPELQKLYDALGLNDQLQPEAGKKVGSDSLAQGPQPSRLHALRPSATCRCGRGVSGMSRSCPDHGGDPAVGQSIHGLVRPMPQRPQGNRRQKGVSFHGLCNLSLLRKNPMLELEQAPGPTDPNRSSTGELSSGWPASPLPGRWLAGCQRAPVQEACPPLVQPEEVVPGRSVSYASTCGGCNAGCGLLVKTRDGRPIKLEGNPSHPLSLGGMCAAGQASILGLYDRLRLQHPMKNGATATWTSVDAEIKTHLDLIRQQGKAVCFLSSTITSPTTRQAIANFLIGFPNPRHVVYDSLSCSAILDAHFLTHSVRALPHYSINLAEVIVSFAADFLGTWISPVQFAAAYQSGRHLQGPAARLSYHVQFESCLSVTGTKADQRLAVAPGQLGLAMTHLAVRVAQKAGQEWGGGDIPASSVPPRFLDDLAERLWNSRGRCLVLCGSQDLDQQLVCNFLNHLLQNYGSTLDVAEPSYQNQSSDGGLQELLEEIRRGQVGALFVYRSNPLYDLPDNQALTESLRKVPLLVSFACRLDETAAQAQYVCPEPHYLESWNDAEAVAGVVSLYQPVIERLGDTRAPPGKPFLLDGTAPVGL